MRISAKSDYAVRVVAELATAPAGAPVKGERLAISQDMPVKFLENILGSLRTAGIVASRRGAEGGYLLARPATEITIADVIRSVDGPLADVRGQRPEDLEYRGAATRLVDVWIAVRASLREVLERVTIADLAAGKLPAAVEKKAADPEARKRRS
ncbi:MAG TPA: Rrf2 family transcriptional regulator [Acidimicrobiia bacterium]|jgi:Rrf2 family protein